MWEPRWGVIRAVVGGTTAVMVCVTLLGVAKAVWVSGTDEIASFLATMRNIAPHGPFEERIWGLVSFGLVVLCILAVVKILTGFR